MTEMTRAPRRWKVWVLTVCGIYPVLAVATTAVGTVFHGAPGLVRLAVVVPIAVAAMTWVIMPFLHRRLGRWLSR